jgi:hypothetical protein
LDCRELGPAPEHRGAIADRAGRSTAQTPEPPGCQQRGLALRADVGDRLAVHGFAEEGQRGGFKQHLTRAGHGLESGRGVDGIAGGVGPPVIASPTITSPLVMPVRIAMVTLRSTANIAFRGPTAACIASAARAARRASSS